MLSRTSLRRRASRLESSSSIKTQPRIAPDRRAIATRWRWPPEAPVCGRAAPPAAASAPRPPAAASCFFSFLAHLHAEGDVCRRLPSKIWKQGIVLEDHREVALARRGGGDVLIMQPDLAFRFDRFQPGEQA